MKQLPVILLALNACFVVPASAQLFGAKYTGTHADSVRGSYGTYRNWWDVQKYDLQVEPDITAHTLTGKNTISFTVLRTPDKLQLDLQKPMRLDSVLYKGKKLSFERYEQAYLVTINPLPRVGDQVVLEAYYHGMPREATNPPWDGGLIWTTDDEGNPWVSVACQGLGASVWWPVKDHGSDEPDQGVRLSVTVPLNMVDASNGRLQGEQTVGTKKMYTWEVKAPINIYDVTMNVGQYIHFGDVYSGLSGPLSVDFWFLKQHEAIAKKHLLEETKEMLKTFEYWFGPYPFYEDGYKLIETPFLGMEHQSGIAYGNKFMKGYLGSDLSNTGWGLKWDYILVHESGHEWFGNNISTDDVADMWVHEGFTTYSEVLFVQTRYGKKAGDEYARGLRNNILNDKPIIGPYGINREGSGDMYFKGVQIIHTYRQILNDDEKFRDMLHEMNRRFGHKTTTTQAVEALMQEYVPGVPLKPFFDTYLRTIYVPALSRIWIKADKGYRLQLQFTNVESGFTMPVDITVGKQSYRVTVSDESTATDITDSAGKSEVTVSPNYYVTVQP